MADTKIRIRPSGPFVVEGPFVLTDSDGSEFPIDSSKPAIALCRCGNSEKMPFCDGAHNRCDFESDPKA